MRGQPVSPPLVFIIAVTVTVPTTLCFSRGISTVVKVNWTRDREKKVGHWAHKFVLGLLSLAAHTSCGLRIWKVKA